MNKPKNLINRGCQTEILHIHSLVKTPDTQNPRKKVLTIGEELDIETCLNKFHQVAHTVQNIAQHILNEREKDIIKGLYDSEGKRITSQANSLGRDLMCTTKSLCFHNTWDEKRFCAEYIGKSRVDELIAASVVTSARGTDTRRRKVNSIIGNVLYGTEIEKMTSGDKRTVRPNPSQPGKVLDFSVVDSQYCKFVEKTRTTITYDVICKDQWVRITLLIPEHFRDADYFASPKLAWSKDNVLSVIITAQYLPKHYEISDRYVIGVDVGIVHYVTYVVYDRQENCVVESGRLSNYLDKELHVREKKIRNHIVNLWDKIRVLKTPNVFGFVTEENTNLIEKKYEEICRQRKGLSRLRKHKAIVASRELLAVSVRYGNAALVRENLGFVGNTMENGRWNCGELFSRIYDQFEFHGGYSLWVSAWMTSKTCSQCGNRSLKEDEAGHDFYQVMQGRDMHCENCGLIIDRDINACVNIARRGFERIDAVISRRKKSGKSYVAQPDFTIVTKSYVPEYMRKKQSKKDKVKAADRTKSTPTPKRYDVEKSRPSGFVIPEEMKKSIREKEVKKVCEKLLYPSCFNSIRGLRVDMSSVQAAFYETLFCEFEKNAKN